MTKSRIWKCRKDTDAKLETYRPLPPIKPLITHYVTPNGIYDDPEFAAQINHISRSVLHFRMINFNYPRYSMEYRKNSITGSSRLSKKIIQGPDGLKFSAFTKAGEHYRLTTKEVRHLINSDKFPNWIRLE